MGILFSSSKDQEIPCFNTNNRKIPTRPDKSKSNYKKLDEETEEIIIEDLEDTPKYHKPQTFNPNKSPKMFSTKLRPSSSIQEASYQPTMSEKNLTSKLLNEIKLRVGNDISILESFVQKYKNSPDFQLAVENIFWYSENSNISLSSNHILTRGKSSEMTFNSLESAFILADMLLCKSKRQNSKFLHRDYDFTRLYQRNQRDECKLEKLKKIFDFFANARNMRNKLVVKRYVQNQRDRITINYLLSCSTPLSKITIKETGLIEDARDSTWIDFANKYIGGGVLGSGYVQEEKLFASNPELIPLILVTEALNDNEVLSMTLFKPNSVQEIIAMDAVDFTGDKTRQYSPDMIERELNKSYLSFSNAQNKSIATGNWGCGAFSGDPQLKLLIQWISASLAKRNLIYYSGNDKRLRGLGPVLKGLESKDVRILVRRMMKAISKMDRDNDLFAVMNQLRERGD